MTPEEEMARFQAWSPKDLRGRILWRKAVRKQIDREIAAMSKALRNQRKASQAGEPDEKLR